MTETSRLRTDSPSESLSPVITKSTTSPNTTQPSSDDKFSQDQTPVDSHIMEQDHTGVSEEHGGGGFDPNGHYQHGKFYTVPSAIHIFVSIYIHFMFSSLCIYMPPLRFSQLVELLSNIYITLTIYTYIHPMFVPDEAPFVDIPPLSTCYYTFIKNSLQVELNDTHLLPVELPYLELSFLL